METQYGSTDTAAKGDGTMAKRQAAAVVSGALLLALLAGCSGGKEHAAEKAAEAPEVSGLAVAPAAAEQVPLTRELAGGVQASAVTRVAARIMAQVSSVAVREGDRVAKGQVLVILDDRELAAKVRQAEGGLRQAEAARQQADAQVELAAATHTRFRALLEGRAVSRQEYEQVATQEALARAGAAQAASAVAQAASAVEEARTWLAFATIASPVAGRVSARSVEAGSIAAPGQPLLAIEQEGRYRIEVPVDGALAGTVVRGTPLAVAVEAAGFAGTVPVTEVVPAADPATRTFVVKADLPADPRLGSGQYARVSVALGARPAVTVPEGALVRRGQLDGVYVEEAGRLAFRIVQTGLPAGSGRREILSGLASGERVVVAGADRAVDGARLAGEGR